MLSMGMQEKKRLIILQYFYGCYFQLSTMSIVDYGQSAEDHQGLLVLVRHTGHQLPQKKFIKIWERVHKLTYVAVPGQTRSALVRYKRFYPKENNEWGDFQAHRKALGLISVGQCSNTAEFEELFDNYKKVKEEYASTLYNSRLIVLGMNRDGTSLNTEENQTNDKTLENESSEEKAGDTLIFDNVKSLDSDHNENSGSGSTVTTDSSVEERKLDSPSHSEDSGVTSDVSPTESSSDISDKKLTSSSAKDDGGQITFISTKSNRTSKREQGASPKVNNKVSNLEKINSNSATKESTGSEVVFYPSVDDCSDLEEKIKEFITSLFFVLEGKRLDRSFERQDRIQLLCAPFEKKDYVGLDTDTK